MKIGTLTFHTAHNYGAMLQAYALVKYIQLQGHDAEIIDYRAEFNEKRFAPKPISHFFSLREIYNIIFRNSYQKPCPHAFEGFYKNYLNVSAKSYRKEELAESSKNYDRIVTGSDQVWNLACTADDDAYFLPFCDDAKKYSYAASLGITSVKDELRQRLRSYIVPFKGVSVREKEAVEIVRDITDIEATQVVDPTMLLTKNEWAKIADYSRCPNDKYAVMYLMSEDLELMRFAQRYSKVHSLKLLYISQRFFKRIKAEYLRDVTPNQWLGLFLNADTIITNSFHGSAFGINFGKNIFLKYIPRSIANSRMQTLVNTYPLCDHLLTSENICKSDFSTLDFVGIGKELSIQRNLSYDYISNVVLK